MNRATLPLTAASRLPEAIDAERPDATCRESRASRSAQSRACVPSSPASSMMRRFLGIGSAA